MLKWKKLRMKYKRVEQGNKFGRLICMEKVNGSGFGGAIWRCRCDCGREADISEAMLISGIARSCGCRSGRIINLQGVRFGMLTVLEPVPERAVDGSVRWLCRCECGNYVTLSTNKLNMGRSTSCGCNLGVRAREAKTYIDGTCVEIMLSDTVSKNNTSGYRGVAKKRDKWQAYINYSGKRIFLGSFETKELAAEARQEAERKIRKHLESLMNETEERQEERYAGQRSV